MPLDRLFHSRLGHSQKVCALSDFEFRVWSQYQLSADDCGVMRASAITVQADNDALAQRPARQVQAAIERLVDVGLVLAFEHQGYRYVCQFDWQDFQHVKHPRQTMNPCPPADIVEKCSPKTRELFLRRSGNSSEELPEDFGKVSEGVQKDSGRSRARETATAMATAEAEATAEAPAASSVPFAAFWDAWPSAHRVGRKQAEDQWARLKPEDRERAIGAVRWRVEHDPAWQAPREDGRWAIPHPFRYLRDRRFTDAQVVAVARKPSAPAGSGFLAEAKRIRTSVWMGRCKHDPPCASFAECVGTLARELQERAEQPA